MTISHTYTSYQFQENHAKMDSFASTSLERPTMETAKLLQASIESSTSVAAWLRCYQ